MYNKYLVIDKSILPDIFDKVINAKELLRTGKAKEVTEAVKKVGISRSTFYKYKDYVFTVSEGGIGRKVTISLLLNHRPGLLSNILNIIANAKGNILTINQDIPINSTANVSITFDRANTIVELDVILQQIKEMTGVAKLRLIAME
ncbi:ACT domain-containing protein [Abyssisolibacter fermentans]|uniref:ACT domain-containing protein n=1 Tax=Abyssisolibacter fermentans TaxID=1766203 RepID=UPI0008377988|nr:ACT domain-containing protein [Abyssisolibacter fermentans]